MCMSYESEVSTFIHCWVLTCLNGVYQKATSAQHVIYVASNVDMLIDAVQMASSFIDKVLRQEVERRGEVWSGVDMVPSFWNPEIRVLKDKSLMETWEGAYGVAE